MFHAYWVATIPYLSLKGQRHEMVVEIRPWSGRYRPKLMVLNPFFCSKIARLKATVRTVAHPLM
jgi:hypothetical protein